MSTPVTQHAINFCCNSSPPKHPKCPYEIRSNSAPQTPPANHKTSDLTKRAPQGLSPEDSPEKGLESTESSFGKQEVPDDAPVAVQLHVPASTDPSSLRDVCEQSIDPDDSTSNVRRVLNYLSKPHKNYMEFRGVRAREFGLIEQTLNETDQVSTKPRLTYDCNTRILIIIMPSVLREASFDDVKDFVGDSIKALPYDRAVISPKTHMLWSLEIPDGVVIPDMTVSVTALEGPTEVVLIPFVGECAHTETDKHVFEKVEKVILAHPDTICVVVVLAREAAEYAAPGKDSTASKVLHGGTDSSPKPLSLKEFINLRTTPRSFGEPIIIADHAWCHLSSVEYFVWARGDDGPIDIRSEDPAHMAYGTLVPTLDMDAVTEMLKRGLTKIRDSFVTFQKQLVPDLDCTALAEAHVTSFTDWHNASKRIMSASDITAHKRYLAWHRSLFDTTENSDHAPYVPSQEEEPEHAIAEGSKHKLASTFEYPSSRFKIPRATAT